MKYKMNNLEYKKSPQDFSKNTQKELLNALFEKRINYIDELV